MYLIKFCSPTKSTKAKDANFKTDDCVIMAILGVIASIVGVTQKTPPFKNATLQISIPSHSLPFKLANFQNTLPFKKETVP